MMEPRRSREYEAALERLTALLLAAQVLREREALRAAVYSRSRRAAERDRQEEVCEEYARRRGWSVAHRYWDSVREVGYIYGDGVPWEACVAGVPPGGDGVQFLLREVVAVGAGLPWDVLLLTAGAAAAVMPGVAGVVDPLAVVAYRLRLSGGSASLAPIEV